jgi:hypothetical protein
MPLAKVWRGVARRPKKLAVSGKSRVEDRNVGIGGDGGIEPALVGVEAGNNGAASRCAGAGRGVVVGEFYAALPDVFEEVGHEPPEVVFGIVTPMGKTVGHRNSSTRMKRMLGLAPGSVMFLEKPRRVATFAPAIAAVVFRKSLRFIVYSPIDETRCC